jgi:hypothetical protein
VARYPLKYKFLESLLFDSRFRALWLSPRLFLFFRIFVWIYHTYTHASFSIKETERSCSALPSTIYECLRGTASRTRLRGRARWLGFKGACKVARFQYWLL